MDYGKLQLLSQYRVIIDALCAVIPLRSDIDKSAAVNGDAFRVRPGGVRIVGILLEPYPLALIKAVCKA